MEFRENVYTVKKGEKLSRNKFLHRLVEALYSRTTADFLRGNFRVKGDTVDINLAYADYSLRVSFFGDEIEELEYFETTSGKPFEKLEEVVIYPANIFVTSPETMQSAIFQIQDDMVKQVEYFKEIGKPLEAKRLEDRVTYDLEMMRELGYCSGIENYSRYFDKRSPGSRPFCLLDYFPEDYLMVIDESHVTLGQIKAMYGGDRSRKVNLVEYGFRLPAAMDNRPLTYDEFETMYKQVIYVSATPSEYELQKSEGIVAEQLIRPTGLLDPIIEVRPSINQVDDLLEEIDKTAKKDERILVTTLTKRMAEELSKYMLNIGIRCRYIHSDVETLERVEIMRDLRLGKFDVLIGINLLREGLDLPEVSLVAILDADKEGFLRSSRALTQTAGRAARNINGKVIMYADKITDSMKQTIDETERRRQKQIAYNIANGLVPTALNKSKESVMGASSILVDAKGNLARPYVENEKVDYAADPVVQYMSKEELNKAILRTRKAMEAAAKGFDFIEAARLRDEMFALEKMFASK
jgi:excinuclease ABC subunit B